VDGSGAGMVLIQYGLRYDRGNQKNGKVEDKDLAKKMIDKGVEERKTEKTRGYAHKGIM
jgi:hypothetical protein